MKTIIKFGINRGWMGCTFCLLMIISIADSIIAVIYGDVCISLQAIMYLMVAILLFGQLEVELKEK